MTNRTMTQKCLLAGMTALSLAFLPTLQSQTTAPTTANPTGSEADSKAANSSTAQVNGGSTGMGTTASTTPDKTSSKDTTDSLDKNPSLAPSDSANNSATKDPTTATTEDRKTQTATSESPAPFSDKHFLMKAAQGGMTEVQLGQLAQQKASSDDVKQFGSHMVMDHSKANDELKGLAQQKGVSVPTKLDAHHQATVDRLSKLSGPAFDKAYVSCMVDDHEKTVADFKRASTSAQDPDVKSFAANTLPVLQGHLADIQNIQSKLK